MKEQYQKLISHLPIGYAYCKVVYDQQGDPCDLLVLEMNEIFEQLTGFSRKILIGKSIKNNGIYSLKAVNEWIQTYGRLGKDQTELVVNEYFLLSEKHCQVNAYSPEKDYFIALVTDLSNEKKQYDELKQIKSSTKQLQESEERYRILFENSVESEEKYRLLTEHASDVIWILNLTKNKFTYISPAIYQLRGYSPEEAMNQSLMESLTPSSAKDVSRVLHENLNNFDPNAEDNQYHIHEVQQPCKDGSVIWVEISVKYRYNKFGELEIIGVSRNIEDRKRQQEQVMFLSYYDQLTGLYNRRFYEEEIKRLDTSRNFPITLVMADVNGLKLTNDAFGHLAGDGLLKKIAEILKKDARVDDIIARTGGDEFVILLPKTDSQEAESIVHRILDDFKKETHGDIMISVSFGWATKTKPDQTMENIFAEAEDFMYRHKLMESKSMKNQTIKLITKSLYEKDSLEEKHAQEVANTCELIGKALGMTVQEISDLRLMGLLHDIGKISLDKGILMKEGLLERSEILEMQRHSETGYQILRAASEFVHIAEYVLCHHENYDGTGYPRGISGEQIPIQSRILRVADVYAFMSIDSRMQVAKEKMDIIKSLESGKNHEFDPTIVDVLVGQLR